MSIGKKNKDHLEEHSSVTLVTPVTAPRSDDPLRFWTEHLTENTLVDLYPFADGQNQKPHPRGCGNWAGPFSGRPELIRQLAPAIHARLLMASPSTVELHRVALRAWWRLLDALEATLGPNGQPVPKVKSLVDLNELHEATAHRFRMTHSNFNTFLSLVNAARKLHRPRLPLLPWIPPKPRNQDRHLIPEDQAQALKILLKQDWESVRRTWARYDAIRFGDRPTKLSKNETLDEQTREEYAEDERLLKNWEHFHRIQEAAGRPLPTSAQLLDGKNRSSLWFQGIEVRLARAILFPTVEDADIAFHLALAGSGWNPSTLARIDASKPTLIFDHPKTSSQTVLSTEEETITIKADKPRARGKTQFCIGLKKNPASPPAIVATYLKRSALLREQLRDDLESVKTELARLQTTGATRVAIERQFKRVQRLQEGIRSAWLYVDSTGNINWLNWKIWKRYGTGTKGASVSYLVRVVDRLNEDRAKRGKPLVDHITPSDFRDIYARWVHVQTGGNVLAVMLALGHAGPRSTNNYLENNIFNAENDEHVRRFMAHLFAELEKGRVDLTILAQLVRNGPLTPEMQGRLEEYRHLMRTRMSVGCTDPRRPPAHIAPNHREGKLCGTQRCLHECPNARFLPESLDGIAMRVEELVTLSDHLPRETWLHGEFTQELENGEYLLAELYPPGMVAAARKTWRDKIARGEHLPPGLGFTAARQNFA